MAKNSSTRWTPEDDKRLLELYAAGTSRMSIAAALRRSVKSTPSRLYTLTKAKTAQSGPDQPKNHFPITREIEMDEEFLKPTGGPVSGPRREGRSIYDK
jgi:hypothetical protein